MIVCFDIGGSTIKGALVEDPQQINTVPRLPTPGNDFEAFVAALKSVINRSPKQVRAVSISIAGLQDPKTGKAIVANIPCLHGRPMQKDLEQALGLPVTIANDADCFAMAEAEYGAGAGHPVVFGVILGTGIGGGLVINGQLINARGGYAGEWGHGPVAATQAGSPPLSIPRFPCGCGLAGCLDATCGARGLEKLHHHLHQREASSQAILAQWLNKDISASRTLDVYLDILSAPLAMIINTIGASIVPVGGGLSNVPELIFAIDKAVRRRMLIDPETALIVPAQNRVEPGLIGAAILSLRQRA
nr:ROK family protein [uncultured Cohaesibacter sp.]